MLESILFCDLWTCLCVDCTNPLAYGLKVFARLCRWHVTQQAQPDDLFGLVPSSSSDSTSLTYPVALEAILTAEVGLFSDLLASRTLQAASIFVAVCAFALALLVDCDLFGWRLVHDCGATR
jgi:hypothetical protein